MTTWAFTPPKQFTQRNFLENDQKQTGSSCFWPHLYLALTACDQIDKNASKYQCKRGLKESFELETVSKHFEFVNNWLPEVVRNWLRAGWRDKDLKGIIHPNIKIYLAFTHSQVLSNLHEILTSVNHKRRLCEKCWKLVVIDFNSRGKKQFWKKWLQRIPTFFKICFLCSTEKETVSKRWQKNLNYWLNYCFNIIKIQI